MQLKAMNFQDLHVPNERIREELGDVRSLTEDKIDRILQKFLHDLQQDALEANGWQMMILPYSISKATLNAYTRLLAKKYANMCINCVHPGYVNRDINWHTGTMTVEEGAEGPVMLALLPEGGPTGCYFDRTVAEF
ncbi:UNVERIFIED_CONTAM: Short-chain dehydrogenase/reductase 2b [Sesamum radiatum]|uniref:Short-chain dehydrogenase/reductase 2b n=1 Tax=Sesamum radiatum TaxID=300843 RepID=A0AAW2W1W8_SESRA